LTAITRPEIHARRAAHSRRSPGAEPGGERGHLPVTVAFDGVAPLMAANADSGLPAATDQLELAQSVLLDLAGPDEAAAVGASMSSA